jgi:transposase-like protein
MSNRGEASGRDIERVLAGKVAEGSIVSTDRHQSYPKVLEGLGVAVHNRYDAKDRSGGDINMVNALHSRLKEFLEPFHGVATRRLQRYLGWFCHREQFRKSDADEREVTFADAAAGRYATGKRGYALTPHPFIGYWEDGAMSTVV